MLLRNLVNMILRRVCRNTTFVTGDPAKTVSILEPAAVGGCEWGTLATVAETAAKHNCLLAVNAGFFNTTSGQCLGDVISNGHVAHSSGGVQNAHFGVETDGRLFFGYLPEDVLLEESFTQLVGGVVWLVRGGKNYVDVSKDAEAEDSQETGNLQTFIDVHSARIAVGHDEAGRLVIVAVDGHTWERGMTLYQFSDLLIELGVVNAINLDGGGSTTVILNNSLVNYPGDRCNISDFMYSCEREVSTVICIHDITCVPSNCSGHGDCYHGNCHCYDNWRGIGCDELFCGAGNCSGNGVCTERGCECFPGYHGDTCINQCMLGYHGDRCKQHCNCNHDELCDAITGRCYCEAGYMGFQCETECIYGYYGNECKGVCDCLDGCSCHPVTGQCHRAPSKPTVWQLGHCVADKVIISRDLIPIDPEQYFLLLACLIGVSVIALGSILLNAVLLYQRFTYSLEAKTNLTVKASRGCFQAPTVFDSSSDFNTNHSDADVETSSDEASTSFLLKFGRKRKRQSKILWKRWKRKFHRRKKDDYQLVVDPDEMSAGVQESSFIEQPLSPMTCDPLPNGDIPVNSKKRITSGNTEDLLEEISLELSSPEHQPKNQLVELNSSQTNIFQAFQESAF